MNLACPISWARYASYNLRRSKQVHPEASVSVRGARAVPGGKVQSRNVGTLLTLLAESSRLTISWWQLPTGLPSKQNQVKAMSCCATAAPSQNQSGCKNAWAASDLLFFSTNAAISYLGTAHRSVARPYGMQITHQIIDVRSPIKAFVGDYSKADRLGQTLKTSSITLDQFD